MRCLLIEDNAANAYLVEVLLTRRGHDVSVARTGAEAVAISRLRPFDVILIDLKLPDGDGCAFVPQLASGIWDEPRAPVIAVSAHALAVEQQRALDVGCRGFIEKPIDVATFVERVEALAGKAGSGNDTPADGRSRQAP
jgi:two-component system cell cycle response regulator DivK